MIKTLKASLVPVVMLAAMAFTGNASAEECHHGAQDFKTLCTDRITMTQSVDAEFDITGACVMTLHVEALKDSDEVVVRTKLPSEGEFIKADPEGTLQGGEIVWNIGHMDCGECRTFQVWMRGGEDCKLEFCSTLSYAMPIICTTSKGCCAKLAIEKTGPDAVCLGECLTYEITIENTGNAPASNVVLRDSIPEGLKHATGNREIKMNVGCLMPGERQCYHLALEAERTGSFCNQVTASADNADSVSAQACTDVYQQSLSITKTGTKQQYACRNSEYVITVTNTGDRALKNVGVHDQVPAGMTIVDAHGGNCGCDGVSWNIAELAPGASETFHLTLRADCIGCYTNRVCAFSGSGCCAASDRAEFTTEYIGHAAILVEAVDLCDPLMIGDTTTYHIVVSNQGTASDKNIRIEARISDHLKPTSTCGDLQGSIEGQTVVFEVAEELCPGQCIHLYIDVEGVREGDGRLNIEVRSDLIDNPVIEQESTFVY